jgi:hypothetical protein
VNRLPSGNETRTAVFISSAACANDASAYYIAATGFEAIGKQARNIPKSYGNSVWTSYCLKTMTPNCSGLSSANEVNDEDLLIL